MKVLLHPRSVLLVLGMLAILTPAFAEQDASAKIQAEIEHVRKALNAKPDNDPQWKDAKPTIAKALDQSSEDLHAGRLYVSLESLSTAVSSFRANERATDKSDEQLLKEGMPGIEAELKKAKLQLTTLDQRNQQSSDNVPVVVRALSEKAEDQAIPFLEGGRGFALLNDSPENRANNYSSALYYAGTAEGQAEIAAFYETLNLQRRGSALPLRSFLSELQRLQDRVTASFQPPLSVDHHADFIVLNATLKLAKELDANRHYAGALYQYLSAVQRFGSLNAAAPETTKQAEIKNALEKLRKDLSTSEQDSSLAQLFLERAESRLAKSPSGDDWKTAQVIAEQVLPAYSAALKSAPAQDRPTVPGVTVTLVRWPFT